MMRLVSARSVCSSGLSPTTVTDSSMAPTSSLKSTRSVALTGTIDAVAHDLLEPAQLGRRRGRCRPSGSRRRSCPISFVTAVYAMFVFTSVIVTVTPGHRAARRVDDVADQTALDGLRAAHAGAEQTSAAANRRTDERARQETAHVASSLKRSCKETVVTRTLVLPTPATPGSGCCERPLRRRDPAAGCALSAWCPNRARP